MLQFNILRMKHYSTRFTLYFAVKVDEIASHFYSKFINRPSQMDFLPNTADVHFLN